MERRNDRAFPNERQQTKNKNNIKAKRKPKKCLRILGAQHTEKKKKKIAAA